MDMTIKWGKCMKKIMTSVSVIMILVLSVLGLVGCTPLTVDKYLQKVASTDNFTMEFLWNNIGTVTKDIYEFDKNKFRRLSTAEMVTERNSDGEYEIFNKIYNVWSRGKTMSEADYLEAIGFGKDGGGFGDEFQNTYKKENMTYANKILDLAATDLMGSFDMETDHFSLKKENYDFIFGKNNSSDIVADILLKGGNIVLTMHQANVKLVVTFSKLGSTKVSITDEMRNAESLYN